MRESPLIVGCVSHINRTMCVSHLNSGCVSHIMNVQSHCFTCRPECASYFMYHSRAGHKVGGSVAGGMYYVFQGGRQMQISQQSWSQGWGICSREHVFQGSRGTGRSLQVDLWRLMHDTHTHPNNIVSAIGAL